MQPEERLGWVTAGAAFVIVDAFKFIPSVVPRLICVNNDAIVIFTIVTIFVRVIIRLCPVAQSLPRVKIPPNCFHSFQLLCFIIDQLCFWPMVKSG